MLTLQECLELKNFRIIIKSRRRVGISPLKEFFNEAKDQYKDVYVFDPYVHIDSDFDFCDTKNKFEIFDEQFIEDLVNKQKESGFPKKFIIISKFAEREAIRSTTLQKLFILCLNCGISMCIITYDYAHLHTIFKHNYDLIIDISQTVLKYTQESDLR